MYNTVYCALLSSEEGRYMYMYTIKQHNIHIYTYTCKAGVGQAAYSLLMRANKLKTAAVQGSLACLAPSRQCSLMYVLHM